MADGDKSLNNLRYNQVTQGLEGFGGGSPQWTSLKLVADASSPAGADTQVQYNKSGVFGADANLVWNYSPIELAINSPTNLMGFGYKLQVLCPTGGGVALQRANTTDAIHVDFYEADGVTSPTQVVLDASAVLNFASPGGVRVNSPSVSIKSGGGSGMDASAILAISSTTTGFLPPRMTTTQKNAISGPTEGLVIYDRTLHKLSVFTGSVWETVTSS
jgi:hypothetical protein